MTHNPHDPQVDPILQDALRKAVRQIIREYHLSPAVAEDIEQHVYERLLQRFRVDTCNSPRGKLLEVVVRRILLNYVRKLGAPIRRPHSSCSLSVIVDSDDDGRPIELAAVITDKERNARLEVRVRSDLERLELRLDLEAFMKTLSPEDADLCERLMYDSEAQIVRDLGIPQSTVNDQKRRLLQRFEDRGFRKYL